MTKRSPALLENIIIIVCISILLAIAVPRFMGFHKEAKIAVEKKNVSSIRVGISYYYIESVTKNRYPLYPPVLDSAINSSASPENPFFVYVLAPGGITDSSWRKLDARVYQGYSENFYFCYPDSGDFIEKEIINDEISNLLGLARRNITIDLINQMNAENVITFTDGKQLVGGCGFNS